jgi:hypothetical protein
MFMNTKMKYSKPEIGKLKLKIYTKLIQVTDFMQFVVTLLV